MEKITDKKDQDVAKIVESELIKGRNELFKKLSSKERKDYLERKKIYSLDDLLNLTFEEIVDKCDSLIKEFFKTNVIMFEMLMQYIDYNLKLINDNIKSLNIDKLDFIAICINKLPNDNERSQTMYKRNYYKKWFMETIKKLIEESIRVKVRVEDFNVKGNISPVELELEITNYDNILINDMGEENFMKYMNQHYNSTFKYLKENFEIMAKYPKPQVKTIIEMKKLDDVDIIGLIEMYIYVTKGYIKNKVNLNICLHVMIFNICYLISLLKEGEEKERLKKVSLEIRDEYIKLHKL